MINNTRRKEWRRKELPDPLVAQKLSTGKYYLSCGIPPRQRILKEGSGTKKEIKRALKKRTREKTIFLIRFGNCILKRAKTRFVGFKIASNNIINY